MTLDPADVAAEETLNVTAVVTAGGETYRSNPTPVVVPADILQTETPTIDPVSAGDTTVSGTAEPGATVTITLLLKATQSRLKPMMKATGKQRFLNWQKAIP